MMIEIHPSLFVASLPDAHALLARNPLSEDRRPLAMVHACKDPCHRRLLGYTSRAAPDGVERLVARRGAHLYLNLVDADVGHISRECVEAALSFISERLADGGRVVVHCNQGESRAPSLGLLWLERRGVVKSLEEFRGLYPLYNPASGMREYVRRETGW